MNTDKRLKFRFFILIVLFSSLVVTAKAEVQHNFTVVIDAGHGGRDPGAIGPGGTREKDINLAVTLKLGEKISSRHPNVNVIYTRTTDVFLPVGDRPRIANEAQADLFISIHTNASRNRAAFGAETYTLGVANTQESLEVAMRENSVILLEEDFDLRYQGFDPTSAESYIMFEFMQSQFMEQSVNFASLIQHQFAHTANRNCRGVRQAGFLVLKTAAMPSVLVELGFISNPQEERFMASEAGQTKLTTAIYNAFVEFKENYLRRSHVAIMSDGSAGNNYAQPAVTHITPPVDYSKVVYKVQIFVSRSLLCISDPRFRGLRDVDFYKVGELYKYTFGRTNCRTEAQEMQSEARQFFEGAFVVAFKDGQRIR